MEIKGKVHCFFEQSGTFKREFIKLGIPAEDYDILDNFGETDHTDDLFAEIEKAYEGQPSLFDTIDAENDFIMAFFPCIHFCGVSQMWFNMNHRDYRKWDTKRIIDYILKKNQERAYFFEVLNKFVGVCLMRKIRMVLENPISMQSFLRVFLKQPDIEDYNRMTRGDYMVKPTGYWFWNCEPTHGQTYQKDKEHIALMKLPKAPKAGQCSEKRSLISPDYARNFICDFILGKTQKGIICQLSLFDL